MMKISIRTICFTIIILICIIAIVGAVYFQFVPKDQQSDNTIKNPTAVTEENRKLARKF